MEAPEIASHAPGRAEGERLQRALTQVRRLGRAFASWFAQEPTPPRAFVLFLGVALLLYVRSPYSNSIFDEQEALLANPYVNGHGVGWLQLFERDFWGLPPDRSIGSYRPLPNLLWRCLWQVHDHPWVAHALNVLLHAVNAMLVARVAWHWTRSSSVAWLSGACFVCFALLTETVSGAVGLADVLSGLGVLAALSTLGWQPRAMAAGVFGACLLALFAKESSIAAVAIVPWAVALSARVLHPERPRVALRTVLALGAALAALFLYVQIRKSNFPSPIDPALLRQLPPDAGVFERAIHAALAWFSQPRLPRDPINNALVEVGAFERINTALRIYLSGLGQLLLPLRLSGDYSYAAELPERAVPSARALLGGLCWFAPLLLAALLGLRSWLGFVQRFATGRNALLSLALLTVPVAYFPQSNLLVLLPTIRAERFWYLPAVGGAWLVASGLVALLRSDVVQRLRLGVGLVGLFLGFQALQGRLHALDYNSDLTFWRATASAVPNSAKARLNYGVMLGARGDSQGRLRETGRAMEIAPRWPMAHIYYGDTLCRTQRAADAWPHYRRGFELGPNESNLIALALQCLWDEKALMTYQAELKAVASQHPDSWLDYLVHDTLEHGKEHRGVDPKYRPRGYDQGLSAPQATSTDSPH